MRECLFIVLLVTFAHTYNLDYEFSLLKSGPKNSFFGYSVAQYSSNNGNWIVAGAPLADSSFLSGDQKNKSGAVYRCDATDPKPDCSLSSDQIEFDASGSSTETKSGQWFGVSLSSGGKDKSLVSCGHRYIYHTQAQNYRLMQGKCWGVDKDFDADADLTLNPCTGEDSGADKLNYDNSGWCQAGIGLSSVKEDDSYLLGAVGTKKWQGRVYKTQDDSYQKSKLSDEQLWQDSYFGYSTTRGNFLEENTIYYATGGPRHKSYGKVLVYDSLSAEGSEPLFELPENIEQIQLASGFGIALCSIDSDKNGYAELVVGAPFYAETNEKYNQGKVYVYSRNATTDMLSLWKELHGLRDGTADMNAHFGYAVANAGDVNRDGYPDLVVGAPYENEQTGGVYVFQGSKNGLTEMYTQYIKAASIKSGLTTRDLSTPLKGFGKSFGTGMDLDGNGYNDVLVGAYASDQVVLLRSRPVIKVNIAMSFSPTTIDLSDSAKKCNIKGEQVPCFTMKFCYNFTEKNTDLYPDDKEINIKYDITADPKHPRTDPRINFPEGGNKLSLALLTTQATKCEEKSGLHLVYKDGKILEFPHILFNIEFSIPYGDPAFPKPQPSDSQVVKLDDFPRLEHSFDDDSNQHLVLTKLAFQRECEDCIPDLGLVSPGNQTLRSGNNLFQLNVTVRNKGVDPAYAVSIGFTFPPDLSLYSLFIDGKDRYCDEDTLCKNVFDKFDKNTEKQIGVKLTITKFKPLSENMMQMNISSINQEAANTLNDNSIDITFELKVEADLLIQQGESTQQVTYGGKVEGASSMKNLEQIGDLVQHKYVITNIGPDRLLEANLTISWPQLLKTGKYLLYLYKVESSSRKITCKKSKWMNELDLYPKTSSRKRRNLDNSTIDDDDDTSAVGTTQVQRKAQKGEIVLNCTTAQCRSIDCEIKDANAKERFIVTVYSRLWKSSLLIDHYGQVATVASIAQVNIGGNVSYVKDPKLNNNRVQVYTNIQPVFPPVSKEKIATWMIALAVIAGVILLALLVFGFYKLGFFKRKRTTAGKYGDKNKGDKAEKSLIK